MITKALTTRNLRQKVYEITKNFVISNEVPPGGKINEDDLAQSLGVSKTPIREALSKLAHDGIVQIIPNRGSFKVQLTKEDIMEILIIRETLEGLCVRLAAQKANGRMIRKLKSILDQFETRHSGDDFPGYVETHQKFHAVIHEASGSQRLAHILKSIYDLTHMVRFQYFNHPEKIKRSLKLHRELIEALERKDGKAAERIRRYTMRSAYESLIQVL